MIPGLSKTAFFASAMAEDRAGYGTHSIALQRNGRRSLPVVCLWFASLLACLVFTARAQAAGGSAQAWGRNDHGQLGNGTMSPSSTPIPVPGLSNVVALAGGNNHSLALLSDGTVRAWGDNSFGQLGNGTMSPSSTPIPVPGLSNVVAIAAGNGDHSLALRMDGTVVAWGRNDDGELGDGTTNTTGCKCIASPVPVSGLSNVVAIAAGDYSGMALLSDGTVRDWGYNYRGDLGNGTTTTTGCHCVPTPVMVSGLSSVVAIAHGTYDGLALLANGTVMDWGLNESGELGNGTVGTTGCTCSAMPVPVSGLSNVVAIAGGYEYGLALLSSGSVRAWGWNDIGQVGNGTVTTTGCQCVDSPAAVSGLANAAAIAGGGQHALALLANGTGMSWGDNSYGQVGNGTTSTTGCSCIDSATAVDALGGASAVAGGYFHSLALVGPSQTLNVAIAGAGAGSVGGSGILCPQSCSQRFPRAAFASLRAAASPGTQFAGFTGACTGLGPCRLQMSADQSVVATFGPPKGTKITTATIRKKKRTASFSFTAPGAVTGFKCELIKPRRKHHKTPKPRFSNCSGPKLYQHLKPGKYTFKVRARDSVGADPTPAKKTFKI